MLCYGMLCYVCMYVCISVCSMRACMYVYVYEYVCMCYVCYVCISPTLSYCLSACNDYGTSSGSLSSPAPVARSKAVRAS
jgi:hypothetical protein